MGPTNSQYHISAVRSTLCSYPHLLQSPTSSASINTLSIAISIPHTKTVTTQPHTTDYSVQFLLSFVVNRQQSLLLPSITYLESIKEEEMENERRDEQQLKHLGFVKVAAINTILCLSNLYDYAKRNAGPLKPAVGTVEGAVAATVAPLYHKFNRFPNQFLSFLDQKVDEAAVKLDEHAPPVAKQVAGQVQCMIKNATKTAQELIHQAQANGPSAAAHYAASESKEFVLTQTVKAWAKLDQIPPFHAVAEIAVPTAAHWSDRYNNVVTDLSRKGYAIFGYLPLIPVDGIVKAFKKEVAAE